MDVSTPLYGAAREVCPSFPRPDSWDRWEIWRPHLNDEQAVRIFKSIHERQLEFEPFIDARHFPKGLERMGYMIIIASHRDKSFSEITSR